MKTILELNYKKIPVVLIDKSLNKHSNVILFPEKAEKARKAFTKLGLPDLKNTSIDISILLTIKIKSPTKIVGLSFFKRKI